MSHDAKKRKIGESTATATPSESADDIKLLRRVFSQSHTPNLIRTLNESLNTASPEDIQALKRLVEPLIQAASSPLHCVRCHKTYLESRNHNEACVIEHEEPEYAYKGPKNTPIYEAPCCSAEYEYEEYEFGPYPPCYVASHTTNPLVVRYYEGDNESDDDGEREKDDEDDNLDPRNRNVITCARKGCDKK